MTAALESPFDQAYFQASRLTLATLEPDTPYLLVRNNDSSDHGKVECFFTSTDDADRYISRLTAVFDAGRMGEHFHPAPSSLDIEVYTVTRHRPS